MASATKGNVKGLLVGGKCNSIGTQQILHSYFTVYVPKFHSLRPLLSFPPLLSLCTN